MAHWDDSARALKLPARGTLLFVAKAIVSAIHRRAAAVTCITKAHAAEAAASGVAADRIHYVPHGVDTSKFVPASAPERAGLRGRLQWPDTTVVLFLGRISQEKGVLELLEAWRKTSARHPTATLQIVGPDEPGHQLDAGSQARAFIETHGLTSATLAGPTSDAASVIRAADVLVLPSRYEAFPLTVIEAMAAGVPVVASFVGGLQDYLVEGQNALTVSPGDVDELARALDRILDDNTLRERLRHAGREDRSRLV
jgi:glycogen(starch) synthase